MDVKTTLGVESLKATPAVTIATVAQSSGWGMADWVAVATIVYIALQAAYLVWKWRREAKAKAAS